jgi:hypothetical protein
MALARSLPATPGATAGLVMMAGCGRLQEFAVDGAGKFIRYVMRLNL